MLASEIYAKFWMKGYNIYPIPKNALGFVKSNFIDRFSSLNVTDILIVPS